MFLRLALALLFMALVGEKLTLAEHLDLAASCKNSKHICVLHINEDHILFANSTAPELRLVVILNSSSLTYLPKEIFQYAPKLEHISVDWGGISRLSKSDFAGAQKLRTVNFAYNNLLEILDYTFEEAPSLEEIHLHWNKIRTLHSAAFAGLLHLNYLDLRGNEIRELPADLFSVILNLEHIDLGSNLIEEIDASTFSSNLKLRTVILNDNKFAVFEPNSFSSFQSLNTLIITNSAVTELALDTLEELYAANSSLQRCTLEGVTWVEAPHNQLTSFTVHSKNTVTKLELQYNQFEALDDFNFMMNLERLDISHNKIEVLIKGPERLLHLPSLTYLSLAWNELSELTMVEFLNLDELNYLDLSYNKLSHLEASSFVLAFKLKYLYLEGNHLQTFDFQSLIERQPYVEIGLFDNDWLEPELSDSLALLRDHNIRVPDRTKTTTAQIQTTAVPQLEHSVSSLKPEQQHRSSTSSTASSASNEVLPDKANHRHHMTTQMAETTQATRFVEPTGVTGIHPYWTAKDFMALLTLVFVMIILLAQFYRILLEEQCFHWCRRRVTGLNGVSYPRNRNPLLVEEVSTL